LLLLLLFDFLPVFFSLSKGFTIFCNLNLMSGGVYFEFPRISMSGVINAR